jgi:hypothetical protein
MSDTRPRQLRRGRREPRWLAGVPHEHRSGCGLVPVCATKRRRRSFSLALDNGSRAQTRRCQRSSVSGRTKKAPQRRCGSTRLSAASSSRSCGSNRGRPTCRRKIDSSWRRTRISTSFSRSPRATSAINSSSRNTTKYRDDTSKGDLQQTGTPTLPAASPAYACNPIGFLHPTRLPPRAGVSLRRRDLLGGLIHESETVVPTIVVRLELQLRRVSPLGHSGETRRMICQAT